MSRLLDRVKVSTATVGTGTLSLGAALLPYRTFAAGGAVTGDVISYLIENGLDWELGTGAYTAGSPATLARTTFIGSTSGARLNLSGVSSVTATAIAANGDIATNSYVTSSIATLLAGANSWASLQTFNGSLISRDIKLFGGASGQEGGEIDIGYGNGLDGNYVVDVVGNTFRIFSSGPTASGGTNVNFTMDVAGNITLNKPLALAAGGTGASTQAAARTNLGLGTAATYNIGTSGTAVALLNTNNSWSGGNTFAAVTSLSVTANNPSSGTTTLFGGSATNTGFIEFRNAASVREGYIGYIGTGGPINIASDNGAGVQFAGGPVLVPSLKVSAGITALAVPPNVLIDNSGPSLNIAGGGTLGFPSFAGFLLIHNRSTGYMSIFLCAAGSTTVIGSVGGAPVGTLAYDSGISGYRFTNTNGSTCLFSIFALRTQASA